MEQEKPLSKWRTEIHTIIFEADTPWGKRFDVILLICIALSVLTVALESISTLQANYGKWFSIAEWFFTILFTIEYILRLMCVRKPTKYAFSFFGAIDLLSILPTYAALFIAGTQSLMIIRVFRLIRVFRVLKLARYIGEANVLKEALKSSKAKIIVFIVAVISLSCIAGTLMYLIEGEENGFTSIPKSIYWAIVTMTTVGYGDISPHTPMGQTVASILMIMGYGIIAVPTGIVSAELTQAKINGPVSTQSCPSCSHEGHDPDAVYCKYCSVELNHKQEI